MGLGSWVLGRGSWVLGLGSWVLGLGLWVLVLALSHFVVSYLVLPSISLEKTKWKHDIDIDIVLS